MGLYPLPWNWMDFVTASINSGWLKQHHVTSKVRKGKCLLAVSGCLPLEFGHHVVRKPQSPTWRGLEVTGPLPWLIFQLPARSSLPVMEARWHRSAFSSCQRMEPQRAKMSHPHGVLPTFHFMRKINDCWCFKPLSLGMVCYAVRANQNEISSQHIPHDAWLPAVLLHNASECKRLWNWHKQAMIYFREFKESI